MTGAKVGLKQTCFNQPKFSPSPGLIGLLRTDNVTLVALLSVACLIWPALWNGYPIVFADTGTYLSQAVHRYAGWDRPVFYSLFMLPLHLTVTVWPVVVAQALVVPKQRRATKPPKSSKRARLDTKKKRGALKRDLRRPSEE